MSQRFLGRTLVAGGVYVFFLALLELCPGCMGGQTGTEASTGERGDSVGGGPGSAVDNPTNANAGAKGQGGSACSPSEWDAGFGGQDWAGSFAAVAALVDSAGSVRAVDELGTTTQVSLSISSSGKACSSKGGGGVVPVSVFAVSATVTALDGSAQVVIPGEAVVVQTDAGGGPARIDLALAQNCYVSSGVEGMKQCVWGRVDPLTYAGLRLQLDATVQSVAGQTWVLGAFSTYATSAQDCSGTVCKLADWQRLSVVTLASP